MAEHSDAKHPLWYRAELLGRVMPLLRAGECCSLVGTSGTGKSNLVRFLRQRDAQEHYFGDDRTWVVTMDTNGLTRGQLPEEVVLFELMLHRLTREAAVHQMPTEMLAELRRLHADLLQRPTGLLALRYLDYACGWLIEGHAVRLVFVFDQFEDIWKTLGASLFRNLRYLRDEYKYALMYLVFTRERLQTVRRRARGERELPDDHAEVEAFWELFAAHTFGLGVYGERDADAMIDRMARRVGAVVSPEDRRAALATSGRHPALLRAVFWAMQHGAAADPLHLLAVSAVAEECEKIWGDLQPDEREAARRLATGARLGAAEAPALADLLLKEVALGDPPRLASQVLAAYILRQGGAAGVEVDTLLRQVWVDGMLLGARLSPLEFSLLEYLARNAGTVCKREDILRELYREQAPSKNDDRLDAVLRRLRDALGDDAREPRFLFTERGVGVRLAQGRLRE